MTSLDMPAALPPAGTRPRPPGLTGRVALRTPLEGGVVGVLLGVAFGALIGGVITLSATMTAADPDTPGGVAATLVLFLMMAAGIGAVAGGVIGLSCGVVVVLAVCAAWLVARATGRRLSRGMGSLVVPVTVLAAPWLVTGAAKVVAGDLGDGLATFARVGVLPLVVGAAIATWRYRVLTRPRVEVRGPAPAAGWYPDTSLGLLRWFDGTAWTGTTTPWPRTPPPAAPLPAGPPPTAPLP